MELPCSPGGGASGGAPGPRRVVPGEWSQARSQVPTVDVLRDLQRLKGKEAGGGGQICNQGQRASPGPGVGTGSETLGAAGRE